MKLLVVTDSLTEKDDVVRVLIQVLQRKKYEVSLEIRKSAIAEDVRDADIILFNIGTSVGTRGCFRRLLTNNRPLITFCIASMAPYVFKHFQGANVQPLCLSEIYPTDREKALRRLYEQHIPVNESALV